ncbi:hypothetical protein J8TS2_03010 [Lederbergia ruris]|uniref:Uncharacterized protein n=1 Tax=Lederbergia ruris TaxID=217495 RepID=A0ABQ4KF96_9BACI|nr:hypothetical protein [Lederbergia ruris]GIN55982.1 hypothetical protein J8TS2_03010 [Lederbergia ruris]
MKKFTTLSKFADAGTAAVVRADFKEGATKIPDNTRPYMQEVFKVRGTWI